MGNSLGSVSERTNPGRTDDFQREAKEILTPDLFDGLRVEIGQSLSQNLGLTHSFVMGSSTVPSHYQLGANYLRDKIFVTGRFDHAGRLSGAVRVQPLKELASKFEFLLGRSKAECGCLAEVELRGRDFTGELQASSAGATTARWHQAVTDRVSVVGEGVYHRAKKVSLLQGGLRFATPDSVTTLSGSSMGQLITSYTHSLTDRLSLATELFMQPRTHDAIFSVGYQVKLRKAIVRGMVVSNGRVMASVKDEIAPNTALLLSGDLNYLANEYKFGLGLILGQ
ncbi:Translocase of outer mitochondrial membrane 40 [Paratrimastix pyriformis]|uniref:Translocase of outer mitochondrial membrane 40 n=2 Tax=Paratrimastix pyriformis TaxID=342808 RepID=A0ABQ8URW3_9EUKA|nr:Translocase of outer mitochondrial membrane 40 [Paratrimastix pyriformis]